MSEGNLKLLIENKINYFTPGNLEISLLTQYKELIKDDSYFEFVVNSKNCGLFYEQSLLMYSHSNKYNFCNIELVNSILKNEYGEIFNGLISFGGDLFGNQFCFDIVTMSIVFFDSETGKREVIAADFLNWIDVLQNRFDYFIGLELLRGWCSENQLAFNERLCPKIPFVIGGEFKINNLYASAFPEFIKAYSNIAKQVYNLPDGTPVRLKIGGKN